MAAALPLQVREGGRAALAAAGRGAQQGGSRAGLCGQAGERLPRVLAPPLAPIPAPPSPQRLGCSAARTWAAQAPGGAALAEERGQVAGWQPALAAGAHVPHEPARGAVRVR